MQVPLQKETELFFFLFIREEEEEFYQESNSLSNVI